MKFNLSVGANIKKSKIYSSYIFFSFFFPEIHFYCIYENIGQQQVQEEKERKLKEEEENIKREEKIKKLLNRRYFSCPPLDSDYQEIEFYEPKSRFASTEPLVLVEEELYDPFYIEQYKITKNLKTKQTQHKRNNSDSILNTKNNSIDSKEREHSI